MLDEIERKKKMLKLEIENKYDFSNKYKKQKTYKDTQ